MTLSDRDIQDTISSLRLIFWGGLVCVLDVKINGFDLINDLVGMITVTVLLCILGAVSQIKGLRSDPGPGYRGEY